MQEYENFESSIENDNFVTEEIAVTDFSSCKVTVPVLSDEQMQKEIKQKENKRTLSYALLGLLLAPFFCIGIFFSISALVRSSRSIKNTDSTVIKWAHTLSLIGLLLNLIFMVILIAYFATHRYIDIEEVGSIVFA